MTYRFFLIFGETKYKSIMSKNYFISLLLCITYSSLTMYATSNQKWEKETRNSVGKTYSKLTDKLKPWNIPSHIYMVEEFGVIGDGKTINTQAIQKAIDTCSENGGGTVVFSKGEYVTGTFIIKTE